MHARQQPYPGAGDPSGISWRHRSQPHRTRLQRCGDPGPRRPPAQTGGRLSVFRRGLYGLQFLQGSYPRASASERVVGILLFRSDEHPSRWYFSPVFVRYTVSPPRSSAAEAAAAAAASRSAAAAASCSAVAAAAAAAASSSAFWRSASSCAARACIASASCTILMLTVRSFKPSNEHSTRSAFSSTSPTASDDASISNEYRPGEQASV